jgi:very-short-patch-repair endonuclease
MTEARERAAAAATDKVRAQGGIVRSARLIEAGTPKWAVADAVMLGLLVRVRRIWVATADADADLVAAARAGVVLTCVTAAKRRGLWVLDADEPHVGAPSHAGSARMTGATVHWNHPVVPRPPAVLEDPIENVLTLVALCQPRESALAVWESALRRQLVDPRMLERMPLPAVARDLLASASPWSDSGLETFVVPRLLWLRLPLRRQIWIAGHRVDLLIGDRLVLQIDGSHHVGAQREQDIAHDAALRLLGYHVIRVGYWQVLNHWHEVQDLIMRAVAQGLHRAGAGPAHLG